MNELNLENLNSIQISLPLNSTIFAIIVSAILGEWIAIIYRKYGISLSNRKVFSDIFWLLCVTTTIVIMVVKFSIALSLGLVGALSIVRFRAAIKEPEELVYLFLVIGVGIANGAGQYVAAVTVVVLSTIVFFIRHKFYIKKNSSPNEYYSGLILTIDGNSEFKDILGKFLFENFGEDNYKLLSSNFENEKFNCVYRLSSEMSPEKKDLLMNWSSEQSKKGLKISFGTQTFLSQ